MHTRWTNIFDDPESLLVENLSGENVSVAITDYGRLRYMGYFERPDSKLKIYQCTEAAYGRGLCGVSLPENIAVQPSQQMNRDFYRNGNLSPNQLDTFTMELFSPGYYCVILGESAPNQMVSMHFRHQFGEIPAHYYPLIRFHTWLCLIYGIVMGVFLIRILQFRRDLVLIQVGVQIISIC